MPPRYLYDMCLASIFLILEHKFKLVEYSAVPSVLVLCEKVFTGVSFYMSNACSDTDYHNI